MNREQKAAVVAELAEQIGSSQAVIAVDYRGLSVPQAAEVRSQLRDADATLKDVKNTLTERAADQAGAEALKELLEGPTALTFVRGDVALAAKAINTFHKEHEVLEFKGGLMDGNALSPDDLKAIAKLPARDVLHAQLVGTVAAPLNGIVRGLANLISGLASQLEQIREQGLVTGEAAAPEAKTEAPAEEAKAEEAKAEEAPAEGEGEAKAEEPAADDAKTEDAPASEPAAEAGDSADGDAPAEGEAAEDENKEDQ
jgi:large subunit ribosomal protein L10